MSELITRCTFLKTTGAAALVAAAGSMLVGCGDGAYASTPENLVAPPIDNSDFANFFWLFYRRYRPLERAVDFQLHL